MVIFTLAVPLTDLVTDPMTLLLSRYFFLSFLLSVTLAVALHVVGQVMETLTPLARDADLTQPVTPVPGAPGVPGVPGRVAESTDSQTMKPSAATTSAVSTTAWSAPAPQLTASTSPSRARTMSAPPGQL